MKILDQHVKKTRLQRLGAPRNTSLMTLASQAKEPFSFSKTKLLCFAYQIYVSFVLSKLFYHNWQLTIVTTKKIKSGSKLSLHFQHKDFKSKKKKKVIKTGHFETRNWSRGRIWWLTDCTVCLQHNFLDFGVKEGMTVSSTSLACPILRMCRS